MAVNYLSEPLQLGHWVAPVDLNLLSSVLTYKDSQFTQNAAKVQQQIDAFGNLDVIKPEQKQYLNSKINGLVDGINKLGGVDLGNPSTVNQIESLGQDIYGDNIITNAVADARQVRQVQAEYQKFRTDPKFKGMYSSVNEWNFNQDLNKWVSDGKLDSRASDYGVPSQAIPFTDIDKMYRDEARKMRPFLKEDATRQGWYIDTRTGKSLSQDQIARTIYESIMTNPNALQQAKLNARYFTEGRGMDGAAVMDKLINQNDYNIEQAEQAVNYHKERMQLAINDPKQYQLEKENKEQADIYLAKLKQQKELYKTKGIDLYNQDPTSFQLTSYLNDFTKAIGRTYQINEQKQSLKFDQGKAFEINYAQKEKQMALQGAIHGMYFDPSTQQWTKVGGFGVGSNGSITGGGVVLQPDVNPNPESYQETEKKFQDQITTLETSKHNEFVKFLQHHANTDASFLKDDKGRIVAQDFLAGADKNFTPEDLTPEKLAEAQNKNLITPQQSKWLSDIYKAYQAKAEGKDYGNTGVPDDFSTLYETIDSYNREIRLNKETLQKAAEGLNLTTKEKELYADYLANPQKYITKRKQISGGLTTRTIEVEDVDPRIEAIEDKLPTDSKKEFWNGISKRPQYYLQVFNDKDQETYSGLKNVVISKNIEGLKNVPASNIRLVGIGHRNDGSDGYKIDVNVTKGSGNKQTTEIIPINLETFELTSNIPSFVPLSKQDVQLDREVKLNGKSYDYIINQKSDNGKVNAAIKINVVPADYTNSSYKVQLLREGLPPITLTQPFPQPQLALQAAKTKLKGITNQLAAQGKKWNYDEFLNTIINNN